MRLAAFLSHDTNIERILASWEAFAATLLPAAASMSALALRNHAPHILSAIAKDLATPQSRQQQVEKSLGRAPLASDAPATAAQTHAVLCARAGFDINQLVAEYRALRASVLREWMDQGPLEASGTEDLMRFNEAIDQAIAESVGHFHRQVERARNLLLGMLGHDLRSPLATIFSTASYLTALNVGDEVSVAAERLIRSGASIQALLDDLVDFSRTRLGLGIKVAPTQLDLAPVLNDELEQWRGAHPQRRFEFAACGDCHGEWDPMRLQQVLRNLLSNATKYGTPDTPIRVTLRGEERQVRLEVSNQGPALDASRLDELCDPLRRGIGIAAGEHPESLGLGLFIVREIARAHGGDVAVHSEGGETSFVVSLPRHQARDAG